MSTYNLLLFTPFGGKGGVINFCEVLSRNLSSSFRVGHLLLGDRPENRSFTKKLLYVVCSAYTLVIKLRRHNYDIIHMNPSFAIYSLLRDSFYLLIVNRLGYGNRTVVFFHGWEDRLSDRIIGNSLYKRIFLKLYEKAGIIFVLNKRYREYLIRMGIEPEKIRVSSAIYERIDGIEKTSRKKAVGKVNILFMSLFLEGKGVRITAEVAKLLVENGYSDFHLSFAGDGPLMPELRKFVAENNLGEYIDILGYVRGKEKEEVLLEADILLFPSWFLGEAFPAVVIEAMGAEQVVIATPHAMIPNIVDDEENGFIYDSKDPNIFYQAVMRLLEDRQLLQKMQERAREKAERNYEASSYMKRMESIYLSVMRSASGVYRCSDKEF